ncbi:hypothetical protein ACFW3A_21770 [Streptomyces pilosus]|uniref:hypothetical protein n=1 Tax=Streptomyces pilosus TaxID=28893 RepID=UPI00363B109B
MSLLRRATTPPASTGGVSGPVKAAMAGPQQRLLLRGVVASHAMSAIVAVPGPQGVNNP